MEDHTVRVNKDNLELLKKFKKQWSLSYNDIIGMGLKTLNGVKKSELSVQSSVYQIRVSLNRVRINENVTNLLSSGYDLFIPEITHRQAMYVKRKLKSMGFSVEYIKSEGDGKSGFLFVQKKEKPKRAKADAMVGPVQLAEPQTA